MKTFMLWVAVVIGMLAGFIWGNADMRGAMLVLACFIALGAGVYLIDVAKKPYNYPCRECRAGYHTGCCWDEECQKYIARNR